ncbi:hypothetical protein K439DRAFT_403517 [Ramaria rubella]|nr:hypothetical protein K439DRAFT_403517 [Ramaria rubella]
MDVYGYVGPEPQGLSEVGGEMRMGMGLSWRERDWAWVEVRVPHPTHAMTNCSSNAGISTSIWATMYEDFTPFDLYNSTTDGTGPASTPLACEDAALVERGMDLFTWGTNR